jgi:hypothetical protein
MQKVVQDMAGEPDDTRRLPAAFECAQIVVVHVGQISIHAADLEEWLDD